MIIANNITEQVAKEILSKQRSVGKNFILYRSIDNIPEYLKKQIVRKYFMIEADDFYFNEEFCYISIDYFRELNTNGKKELIENIKNCKLLIHNLDTYKSISNFISNYSSKDIENYDEFLDLLCEKEFRILLTSLKGNNIVRITSLSKSYIDTENFKIETNEQTKQL